MFHEHYSHSMSPLQGKAPQLTHLINSPGRAWFCQKHTSQWYMPFTAYHSYMWNSFVNKAMFLKKEFYSKPMGCREVMVSCTPARSAVGKQLQITFFWATWCSLNMQSVCCYKGKYWGGVNYRGKKYIKDPFRNLGLKNIYVINGGQNIALASSA